MSYYLHPELQLLDYDRCDDYVNSPKCELLDLLLYQSEKSISGESDNGEWSKEEFINGFGQALADGMLADCIRKVYYPSHSFEEAMDKSAKAFDKLICTPSVLMEVHEDCCFIIGDKRQIKIFIMNMGENEEGRTAYQMIETMEGHVTFWTGYSMSADSEDIYMDYCFHPDGDDALGEMYREQYGEDYTDWDLMWGRMQVVYGYLVFKRYSDVEMEEVVREKTLKKSGILRDKVNNFMGINVTLLDSRWFTTICRNEGFAVSGHFRLQPYKDGTRKLIYIAPFMKTGYHRQARIEKEKE